MIVRLVLCAVAGGAILCTGAPSHAQPTSDAALSAQQTLEASATKKRLRTTRHHARPSYAYRVPRYGRLGDPSLSPSGLPYRRPSHLGSCVFDEGYGRFSACPNE